MVTPSRHRVPASLRAVVVLITGALLCGAAPAPESTDSVKTALGEGREAFLAKDYETAVRWLQRAYQLKPSDPDIPFNIGRCFEELGRFHEAVKSFQQVADHRRATAADRTSAQSKLAAITPLLSKAHIRLEEPLRAGLVLVDGKQIAAGVSDVQLTPGTREICALDATGAALLCWKRQLPVGQRVSWPPPDPTGLRSTVLWQPSEPVARVEMGGVTLPVNPARLERLVLDPGTHRLLVVWAGGGETELTWELAPGMQLEGQPARPAAAAVAPPQMRDEGLMVSAVEAETSSDGPGAGPWITLGVGGAVLVAGVSLMGAAEASRSGIESDRERGTISQPTAESRWGDANTMTWIGTGLLAAGGAAALGGVLWFALSGGDEETDADGAQGARFEVVPMVTGGALVRGSF